MTLDDIKLQIASKFSEVDLLDFLGIDIHDLVEILEAEIAEEQERFRESFARD